MAQKKLVQKEQAEVTRENISRDLQLVIDSKSACKTNEAEKRLDNLASKMEQQFADAIERLENSKGLLPAAKISLNNQNHLDKLVQLFYLIQNLQHPGSRTEQLFSGFNHIDLATILRLHFREFADKKPNTVEKNAKASIDKLRPNDPKVQKLTQVIEEFFYA